MKILLIFTFFLISGPASCSDVIGYSRGSVVIYCNYQQDQGNDKYFCKESTKQCVFLKHDQIHNLWDHKGRVSVYDYPSYEVLRVFYRNLSVEDAGLYQCGETGVWSHAVKIVVKEDPCCLGPKTVIGYLRETVTINCSYPEEFQTKIKYIYKRVGERFTDVVNTTYPQIGRFSLSENSRPRVISVRIRDLKEEDVGVYSCAVLIGENGVRYYSIFSEIQLLGSGPSYRTSPAPTTPVITTSKSTTPGSSTATTTIIIIIVSICVVLLLIGGLTLIFYKLRCSRTGDSAHISQRSGTNDTNDCDYENDPPRLRNDISMIPLHQNMDHSVNPNTNKSDSIYQNLNPRTREPESIYYSLKPNRK